MILAISAGERASTQQLRGVPVKEGGGRAEIARSQKGEGTRVFVM